MRLVTFTLSLLTAVCLVGLGCPTAQAANITWSGLGFDGNWATGANWIGGTAPQNNDFSDRGVFGASATPGTITVPSNRDARGVYFETAGWTVGAFSDLQDINSAGLGTNSLGFFNIRNIQSTVTWNISAGNTLDLFNGFYGRNQELIVQGGGTLLIDNDVNGFTSPEMRIRDVTVRVDDPRVYTTSSGGFVTLEDVNSILQLQTTLTGAQNQIGSTIFDGVGNGLTVADIGGGFVQISSTFIAPPDPTPIPEPTTAGLLAFGILALVKRRSNN